jgi:hypothetical protein
MDIGLMCSNHYYCPILTKLEFSRNIFEKFVMKFSENPSSGSRVVPSRRKDGRNDTTKLIVAFRNFNKALKNFSFFKAITPI